MSSTGEPTKIRARLAIPAAGALAVLIVASGPAGALAGPGDPSLPTDRVEVAVTTAPVEAIDQPQVTVPGGPVATSVPAEPADPVTDPGTPPESCDAGEVELADLPSPSTSPPAVAGEGTRGDAPIGEVPATAIGRSGVAAMNRAPKTVPVVWRGPTSLFEVPEIPEVGDSIKFEVEINKNGKWWGLVADAVGAAEKCKKPVVSITVYMKVTKTQYLGAETHLTLQLESITITHSKRSATIHGTSSTETYDLPVVIVPKD